MSALVDKGLPFIRPIPKLTAVADADVSVKCPVAGYPIMEIMWTKGHLFSKMRIVIERIPN